MAVLLIGSTGNGKSTLGNFLLNPDDPHTDQIFRTARDNKPQTQNVKAATKKIAVRGYGKVDLTVVDTPGLNESAAGDLRHTTAIVRFLSKSSVPVIACIIVVKFNSQIDAQYRATIEYYSKLLPRLFEKNIIIVMTAYETDQRSIKMRKRQGIDVDAIKNNTTKEIVKCSGMGYDPILFTVDCLPFDEEEKSLNFRVRDAILQYIITLDPMQFAKTADIQREDSEKISEYNGEVKGYVLCGAVQNMAVLLIGSTGNGKSMFGNFLLNPDDPLTDETFRTARDNMPQTQNVKAATKKIAVQGYGKVDLTVIDTPGLTQTTKDLRHMTAIIKFLVKNSVPVRACIIVVKFSSKIDAQYKATIEYYSKLLPRLFEKNVIIVMTAYETDPRSIKMRKRQGIDVDAIKNNTTKEIVECAGMCYEPILFTVDCLPLDEEEKSLNFQVRDAILQYIIALEPIKLASMQVAKMADIQREDRERISQYKGEVMGYNLRLKQADAASKVALEELEFKEAEITETVGKIARLQSDLHGKYSSDTKISEEKRVLIKLKTERQRIDTRHSDHVKQLKLLHEFIAERRAEIEVLSKDYLSTEEADKRFK